MVDHGHGPQKLREEGSAPRFMSFHVGITEVPLVKGSSASISAVMDIEEIDSFVTFAT